MRLHHPIDKRETVQQLLRVLHEYHHRRHVAMASILTTCVGKDIQQNPGGGKGVKFEMFGFTLLADCFVFRSLDHANRVRVSHLLSLNGTAISRSLQDSECIIPSNDVSGAACSPCCGAYRLTRSTFFWFLRFQYSSISVSMLSICE